MACSLCNTPTMVTVKFNEVLFKEPVKVGNHIKMYGKVTHVGNSSISLYIEARRKNFSKKTTESVVCSTNIVFVRIDKDGNSKAIDKEVRESLGKM